MKNKRIILLLVTSVLVILVFMFTVVSCGKELTCFTVSDREECKKKCGINLFSVKKKYIYNDVNKECCCKD